MLEPYKNNDNQQIINLEIIDFLNNQHILRLYSVFSNNQTFTKIFNPNKLKATINISKIKEKISKSIDLSSDNKKQLNNDIDVLLKDKDYKAINNVYLIFKLIEKEKYFNNIYRIKDPLRNVLRKHGTIAEINRYFNEEVYKVDIEGANFLSLFLNDPKDIPNYELMKLKSASIFFYEILENSDMLSSFEKLINKKIILEEEKEIIGFFPPWVQVEFYDEKKSFKSLSSGEKSFFMLLINILYQVKNIDADSHYNSINIFFDETEIGFHPVWQKAYINDIVDSLSKISNKPINLFFLSHSPFVISDIPKENIIFLDTYGSNDTKVKINPELFGKCKNVSNEIEFNTFGADIHTLLSNAFFMGDSLMGDFAQNKINKILDFYTEIKDEEKEENSDFKILLSKYEKYKKIFYYTYKSISEDYLKQIIQNTLLEIEKKLYKEDKAKKKKIDWLREEADRLEAL